MILRLLSQQYNYHLAVRYIYEIAEIPLSAYHSDIITISLFDISLWERSDATMLLSQRCHYNLTARYLCTWSQQCHCELTDWFRTDIKKLWCSDIIVWLSQQYHYDLADRYLSRRSQRCHLCLSQRCHYDLIARYLCTRSQQCHCELTEWFRTDIKKCIMQRYHFVIITAISLWSHSSISLFEIAAMPLCAYRVISYWHQKVYHAAISSCDYHSDIIMIPQLDISLWDRSDAIVCLQIDFVLILKMYRAAISLCDYHRDIIMISHLDISLRDRGDAIACLQIDFILI